MKVVLESETSKLKIIRNAINLKNKHEGGWKKVCVYQGLTQRQREARKQLVQELKDQLAEGEINLTIYKGAVVKTRLT